MDANFWHDKWEKNQIGFHEANPNPLLTQQIAALNLKDGARLFLPLCGKTLDIAWLLSQGYRVIGAELSEQAIVQLFEELQVSPEIEKTDSFIRYSAENIDILVGDIFDLSRDDIGPVDAIYDRAALVALPHDMRLRYTAHLRALTETAPQLLITFTYDQTQAKGPPFSISEEEVIDHYDENYQVTALKQITVEGGLKGQPATETVWSLT